jgi:hypothetical protein
MTAIRRSADLLGIPPGFWAAVGWEYRRIFRRPWTELLSVAANAALVTGFWLFLPSHLTNWAFSLNGPVAFALVLQVWMLADTFATNVFGTAPEQVLPRINNPRELRVWLWARSFVIWSLVGPACAVVAVALGAGDHHLEIAAFACVVLLVLPIALISITAWVGILFPYHPRPLRWRWEHRRDIRVIVRWALLLYVPYNLILALGFVILAPAILVAKLVGGPNESHRPPLGGVIAETVLICVLALIATVVGHRVAVRLARRRHDQLVAYLADPDRG